MKTVYLDDLHAALMRGDMAMVATWLEERQDPPSGEFRVRVLDRLIQHLRDGDVHHAIAWIENIIYRTPPDPDEQRQCYHHAMEHGL